MCGKITMNDSLFDDVTSLLDGDFGDDRILKQIARACKNNEVISNYERNYVQKLAEQYLGKKPVITPSTLTKTTPSSKPDVTMPKIEPFIQSQTLQSPSLQSNSNSNSNSNLKNSRLLLGFGGTAIVIIIAVAIFSSINIDPVSSNPVPEIKLQLSVQTDLTSYNLKDIISINGVSYNSKIVNLSIKNSDNKLVWAEQLSVKDNGLYSTLAIAGGNGWDVSGTYTLNVDNGSEIKSINFSFTS